MTEQQPQNPFFKKWQEKMLKASENDFALTLKENIKKYQEWAQGPDCENSRRDRIIDLLQMIPKRGEGYADYYMELFKSRECAVQYDDAGLFKEVLSIYPDKEKLFFCGFRHACDAILHYRYKILDYILTANPKMVQEKAGHLIRQAIYFASYNCVEKIRPYIDEKNLTGEHLSEIRRGIIWDIETDSIFDYLMAEGFDLLPEDRPEIIKHFVEELCLHHHTSLLSRVPNYKDILKNSEGFELENGKFVFKVKREEKPSFPTLKLVQ